MGQEKIVKTACLLCPPGCGIDIHVRDNKPVKVESMMESVVGPICIKGELLPEWWETELKDRVMHPLQKVNGNWRQITWDQALDVIAENLTKVKEKYGPEALATYIGSTESHHDFNYLARQFFLAYGSPSFYGSASVCYWTKIISGEVSYGGYAPPSIVGSKCVVVWAGNPTESVPFAGDAIVMSKTQRGTKLIVIDPRRTLLAKAADIHLPIRPGTDAALALAFLNVIISEELYNKDFVDKYTVGFKRLTEHVKDYSPERVAEICDVPADKIRAAAKMYGSTKPATIFQGNCLDTIDNGFQSCRGINCLISVTGNLDTRGGSALMPLHNYSKWARENWQKDGKPLPKAEPAAIADYPLFHDTVGQPNVASLYRGMSEGKPYPIKAWMVETGNPIITLADTNYLRQGIDQLDFMVVHDIFMTETAQLADIMLPAATFYEQNSMYAYVGRPQVALLNKAMEPPEDCWPNGKVWIELAKRMGMEEHFPWKDMDEFHEQFFCPMIGTTIEELKDNPGGWLYRKRAFKKYETEGIGTPTGKVELYSESLAQRGFDPMPTHHEPALSAQMRPDLQKLYPLIIITGQRNINFAQSMLLGVPTLRGKVGEPQAEINTETAKKFGIESGDLMIIETPSGKIQMKASLTHYIHPKVVSVPYGFGGLQNANYLTSWKVTQPEVGMPAYRALPGRVMKALLGEPAKVITAA